MIVFIIVTMIWLIWFGDGGGAAAAAAAAAAGHLVLAGVKLRTRVSSVS